MAAELLCRWAVRAEPRVVQGLKREDGEEAGVRELVGRVPELVQGAELARQLVRHTLNKRSSRRRAVRMINGCVTWVEKKQKAIKNDREKRRAARQNQ